MWFSTMRNETRLIENLIVSATIRRKSDQDQYLIHYLFAQIDCSNWRILLEDTILHAKVAGNDKGAWHEDNLSRSRKRTLKTRQAVCTPNKWALIVTIRSQFVTLEITRVTCNIALRNRVVRQSFFVVNLTRHLPSGRSPRVCNIWHRNDNVQTNKGWLDFNIGENDTSKLRLEMRSGRW
jgi:hypothetical protein